jgi:hypothetical protein
MNRDTPPGREFGNGIRHYPGNSGIEIVVGIEKLLYLPTLLFLFRNSLALPQPPTCAKEIPFPWAEENQKGVSKGLYVTRSEPTLTGEMPSCRWASGT